MKISDCFFTCSTFIAYIKVNRPNFPPKALTNHFAFAIIIGHLSGCGKCYQQFNIWVWLSLVERLVRDQEAGGSNPLTQTIKSKESLRLFVFYYLRKIEQTASQGTNSGPRGNKVKTVRGSVFTAVSTAEQGASEVGEYRRAMRLCERCGPCGMFCLQYRTKPIRDRRLCL